jgi:hypothetical protein
VGLLVSKTTLLGRLPVKFQFGVEYWVVSQHAYGDRAKVVLEVIPVIPKLIGRSLLGGDEPRAGVEIHIGDGTTGGSMARKIGYWVTTALVAAILALAAFAYLTSQPAAVQNFVGLRYPQYFRFILGVAKALAVVALLSPGLALVKEWAYAGLTFTWIGAFVSHTVAGDGKAPLPVALLVLLAVSYLTRPPNRRLPEAAALVPQPGAR